MPKIPKTIKKDELLELGRRIIAQKLLDVGYKPDKKYEMEEGIEINGKIIPMPEVKNASR